MRFLDGLSPNALLALPWLFELWAVAGHQLPPKGDWSTWVIMGGRGAGKTRAGAEWVRAQVEGATPTARGKCRRVALVAETLEQAREVMVFGESGLLACCPPDRRPQWIASRQILQWPNGAVAQIYSANSPERLRGPQFDAAWCDELAKWKKGVEAWDMLKLALRLGEYPRAVVTTTPRNRVVLTRLLATPSTVVSRAPTAANRMNLAKVFLEEVSARYANTRLARQELDGELLIDEPGALWRHGDIEAAHAAPAFKCDRIVVAVDPPVTGHAGSDECGIIVAGVQTDGPPQTWRGIVLEDASIAGASPQAWAKAAVEAFHRHKADRVIAEVNQGGDLVEQMLRQIDPSLPYRAVRASRGKVARAEPVAALYEQGRMVHRGLLTKLEGQMVQMCQQGFTGQGSPDRVDALVWAINELILLPAGAFRCARVRSL
ncbi:MAG: terminase family protein [Paracoccaceae bacterium]